MTSYKDQTVRRELIMKHYATPDHKHTLDSSDVDLFSDHCVDEIHIKLDIKDELIVKAAYDGEGCAIFLSSSDIMIGAIEGKTLSEAKVIVSEYEKMINGTKEYDEELLGKLAIYENVASHFNRLHCAEMVSNALNKIL